MKGRIVFGPCSSSSFSDVSLQCQLWTVSLLSSVFHTELSRIVTDLSRTTQSPASLSRPANAKGCLKNKSNTKNSEGGYSTFGGERGEEDACWLPENVCLKAGLLSSSDRGGKEQDREAKAMKEVTDE